MDDEAEKATRQPMIGWFREREQALRHIANAYAASEDDRIHTPEPLAFDAAASELSRRRGQSAMVAMPVPDDTCGAAWNSPSTASRTNPRGRARACTSS